MRGVILAVFVEAALPRGLARWPYSRIAEDPVNTKEALHPYYSEISAPVARQAGHCLVLAWSFLTVMVLAWLYVCVAGCSTALVQTLGVGYLIIIGLGITISIFRAPDAVVRPVNIFLVSCVFAVVFHAATLSYVRSFSPELLLIADTLIGMYLVAVLSAGHLSGSGSSALVRLFGNADRNLTGSTYFWTVVLVFGLEYLERLYSVGFSGHGLLSVMLSAKNIQDPVAGFAFRRGGGGGWEVFFTPVNSLFLGLTAFVDRAWKRGVSRPKKLILVAVTLMQFTTIALAGSKEPLFIAAALPLAIRAAQHDRSSGRWVVALVLASFLLAPVMDTMTQVRGVGWAAIADVEHVDWNLAQALGEDDLRWTVRFIAYLEGGSGVLAYKGPLGFVAGMRTVGWEWLINPIPRVLWPEKPEPWKRLEPGRPWYATESAVGDLLRYGGVSFVVVGGFLMGLWLGLLDPLYRMPKGDGAAIAYGYLLVATAVMVRSTSPIGAVPPLLTCLIILGLWRFIGLFASPVDTQFAVDWQEEAYIG
jgi:hypothetical protein